MPGMIGRLLPYGELIATLVRRDVVTRYKRSFFGVLWALLEPLGMMVVLATVFSIIIRIDVPDYPLFLLVGLLPWEFFSSTTGRGGGASFVARYHVDRCTYCGQCVQSCKFKCMGMSNEDWELAALDKQSFEVLYGREEDLAVLMERFSGNKPDTAKPE